MDELIHVPAFPRLDEYVGAWAIEPSRAQALWQMAREKDLAAHIAANQTLAPRSRVEYAGGRDGKRVAIIGISGLLMKSESSFGGVSTIAIRRDIRSAAADPNVSAILLAIDSPGGSAAGTDDLAADVRAARSRKPVYAQVEDLAASAAYWIASQAEKIFANSRTALVGSIGTILTMYDTSAAAEKEGIKALVFATGPLKGAGSPGTPITADQQSYFQGIVESTQLSFDAAVKAGRRLSDAQLADVKSGGIFTADEALAKKLIDGIQSIETTLGALASATVTPKGPTMLTTEVQSAVAAERERLANIDKLTAGLDLPAAFQHQLADLKAKAVADEITLTTFQAGLLDMVRASRPTVAIAGSRSSGPLTVDHLVAAMLTRAKFGHVAEQTYGANVMEQSRRLARSSFVDLCRAAIELDHREVPLDRSEMIHAGLSGVTMPTALSNIANKVAASVYATAPATWRLIAQVKSAANFKTQTSVRPTGFFDLDKLGAGGEVKHGRMAEETYTWNVDTYARQFQIDRQQVINDDLSLFDDTIPSMTRAASRTLSALVCSTILGNASSFWSTGHLNYFEGSGTNLQASSLATAIRMLRQMKDGEGNLLDLAPAVLLVPPELEVIGRELLNSSEVQRYVASGTDRAPMGNAMQGVAQLAVEARLSDSGFTGNSSTGWYLFSDAVNTSIVVGFLEGREAPFVETFGLDADINHLSIGFRIYHDFGAALADYRTSIRSKGAA